MLEKHDQYLANDKHDRGIGDEGEPEPMSVEIFNKRPGQLYQHVQRQDIRYQIDVVPRDALERELKDD